MGAKGSRFLSEPECYAMLAREGLPVPSHALVSSPREAVREATRLGFPLVMKVVSPQVLHKSDAGGVRTGLTDEASLREAFREIESAVHSAVPEAEIEGMLLMPHFQGGTELIVGGLRDIQFGPTLMFGVGGIFVELLKDVAFRVAPISQYEAMQMIREIKAYPLLVGFRGRQVLDVETLAGFLAKLSELLADFPEIEELDLNPVFLFAKGLVVADARIIIST